MDREGKTVDNIGDLPPQAQEIFARRGELENLRNSRRVSKNWHSQLIDNNRTLTRPSGPAPAPPTLAPLPSSGSSTTPALVPPLSVLGHPPPQSSASGKTVRLFWRQSDVFMNDKRSL